MARLRCGLWASMMAGCFAIDIGPAAADGVKRATDGIARRMYGHLRCHLCTFAVSAVAGCCRVAILVAAKSRRKQFACLVPCRRAQFCTGPRRWHSSMRAAQCAG